MTSDGDRYIPLTARDGNDRRDYTALHEGVPEWLAPHLIQWIHDSLVWYKTVYGTGLAGRSRREKRWRTDYLQQMELDLQVSISGAATPGEDLLKLCRVNDGMALNVMNWLLEHVEEADASVLANLLSRGASVWKVADGPSAHLERRVVPTLSDLASTVMRSGTPAVEYLRRAWESAWGLNANGDDAYSNAVKAVEAALHPIVSPNNVQATLGTMIATVRDSPQKFAVRLSPQRGADAVTAFREQLEVLWQSHRRHGDPEEIAAMTIDEARDAVTIATHAVDWAHRGAFGRVG